LQLHFISNEYFIENIYSKYLFVHLDPCKFFRFPCDLQTNEPLRLFKNAWICSEHHLLVVNPTVNILELGGINTLMRATSQFQFPIEFHRRFQRHDRQQRTSIIENTILSNVRSVNDFQMQWQGRKPESGEYS
jgi:hypothetical protein